MSSTHRKDQPATRSWTRILCLGLLICLAAIAPSGLSARPLQKPEKVTLIVKMAKGLTLAQAQAIVRGYGATPKVSVQQLDLLVIEVPENAADAITQAMKRDSQILRVESDHTRKWQGVPSDTFYTNQWALPKISWDQVFGTANPRYATKVAILDTGVDATHPDLSGMVVPGYSVFEGSVPLTDENGHGTWLAGIVAAHTDNQQGIAGVGYDYVQIMPVKVLTPDGLGQDSDIIQGVMWATDNGASVILMAFSNPGHSEALQDAIDYAWAHNVVLVAAAGNDANNTATFPAGDRGVMGVSATDTDDNLAPTSTFGPSVFLAAPGVNITGTYPNNSYVVWSGTSGSAAIVAGSAALMRAIDPSLSNGVIVNRIARTADPAGTQEQTGNGRVNLARAIDDTSTVEIQPAGAAPFGDSGPFVGPYRIAAISLNPTEGKTGTSVTVNGGGFGSNKTLTVRWDGAGGAIVTTCSSNNPGNIAGTCQFTVPATSDGSHTVFVSDGTTSFTASFVVDNTAPITASVTTPANGSTFGAGTVPATFSGSAADNAGGLGLTTNTTTFTLQRPDNQYWTGSAWQVAVFNLATTHVATSGNTVAGWTDNVTMPTWAAQPSGTYTVQAKATDRVGNTFTGSAVTFTLDATAPTVTIDSATPNPTSGNTTVTWHANENGTYSVRVGGTTCTTGTAVDSGTYSSQPNTVATNILAASLAEAGNTVRVCVTDAATNVGIITITVTKDSTAPTTAPVTTPANGSTFRAATVPATFSGAAADNLNGTGLNANSTTFSLQRGSDNNYWNGSTWQAGSFALSTTHAATTSSTSSTWTSSATMPVWASESDGAYTIQATATDKVGNVFTGTGVTFTLDATIPLSASVTTPANGSNFTAAAVPGTFSGSASDNAGGVGLNANSTTFTVQRPDGQYWTGSAWQVAVANLATTHAATSGNTAASWNDNVTLPTWSAQPDGTYTVQAKATDKAGNTFTGTAVTFTLDKTAPTVIIDLASPNPTALGTTVTWHANENGSYSIRVGATTCANGNIVDSGSYSSQPNTVPTSIAAGLLAEGSNTIRVCVTDATGNIGNTTVTVTKDSTAPITASVTTPANGSFVNAASVAASFTGSAADNSGGVGLNANSTVFTLKRNSDNTYWNGSTWQVSPIAIPTTHVATTSNTTATWTSAATMPTWASESDGLYTVQATAIDKLGNATNGAAATFTFENTPPVIASVTNPIDGTNFSAGSGPSGAFTGQAADDASGVGLNSGSTTFTLQRGSDALYWTGSAFTSVTAVNLPTTHSATTGGTAVSWTSSGTLPNWASQSAGDYFVQAISTDKAANSFAGPVSTFRILGAITPTVLGTASTGNSTNTTMSLTGLSGMSVASGRTIFVTIAMDGGTGTVSVSDSAGNTYTKDADVTNGTTASDVRTLLFSARVTTALNGSITVTSSANVHMAATFFSFNGLASPFKDQFHTATGTNTSPNSGSTATTAQRDELLIGALGINDKAGGSGFGSFTPGAGFTALTASNPPGSSSHLFTMEPEYQVVTNTGSFSASATIGTSTEWAAAIGTYKVRLPDAPSITLADPTPAANGATVHFTVTFGETVVGLDTADFTLTQSGGVSGSSISSVSGSGTTYSVTVVLGTGTGTVGLNFVDNDTVINLNSIPTGGTGTGTVTTGPVYNTPIQEQTLLSVAAASGTYGGTTTLTATLTKSTGGAPVAGKSIAFTLNGNAVGSATTNSSGVASLASVSLSGINVGTYAAAVAATFDATGDPSYLGSNGNNSLTVNARSLTVTATGVNKTYDGTTTASATLSTNKLGSDDVTASYTTATFANKNVGTAKTVSVSGISISGAAAGNYTLSNTTATTSADISVRALTVSATAVNKQYDGTTSAIETPTITSGTVASGDTANFSQAFTDKNVGTGKTLIPSGSVTDGNGGNNYAITFVNNSNGVITAREITVTAATDTKTYDGTTNSSGTPAITSGTLASGDTAHFTQAFANRNAGIGNKVLVPSGSITDGNGGANYNLTFVNFTTGTINPLAITVTAVNATKTYDGTTAAAGTPTVTPSVVAGDSANFVQAFQDKNAGTGNKLIIPSGSVNDGNSGANYTITFVNFTTGTINRLGITATLVASDKTYDGTNAASITSCAPNGVLAVEAGNVSCSTGPATFASSNASASPQTVTASVTLAGSESGNYSVTSPATTTAYINPKSASVTPNASGKTYGSSDPPLTGALSGFLAGDGVVATYARTAGETVGTYTISAFLSAATGSLSNYNVTYNTANFIIGQKTASVTIDAKTKILGSADPTFTGTLSGFLAADGVTATYSRAAGETVGTYAITATLSPAGVLGNYNISYTGADLTIEKYFFDVCNGINCSGGSNPNTDNIGGRLTINAQIPYLGMGTVAVSLSPATLAGKDALTSPGVDGSNNPLPPQFKVWIVSNDNPSTPILSWNGNAAQVPGPVSGMYTWSASIPVTLTSGFAPGNYKAYVYGYNGSAITSPPVADNDGYSKPDTDNFKYPTLTADLEVIKANQTITFGALGDKTYGDADFAVSATASSGLTVSFSALGSCTVTGTLVHITGAGSCTITASQAGDARYNAATNVDQAFTVHPKPASVTPNAASKTYGDADPAFTGTLSGFLASDGVTASYSRTAGETVTGSPYTISATLSPSGVLGNYTITYNTASFTINKRSASVTPNTASKTYGDADPALTGTLNNFIAADAVTASYSRTAGDTVAGSPYTISATLSPSGVLGNYTITYNTASFTINKRSASVTPNGASKTYGDADPALTGTLNNFIQADAVTASYSRTAGETVSGSSYTISATLSPAGVLGNYNITYNTANFTITPKDASVTPNGATKVYGSADPALTGSLSGFLASDAVTASYHRTSGETVGGSPYTISATLTPTTVLANYNITYNTANFTITAKTASVTPNGATKVYGGADPALTGTLTGFLASDSVTANYSRTSGETVAGSPYTISATLSPAAVLANYNITYNTASFSITTKNASVTPNPAGKMYGSADPSFTGSLSGFLASDGVSASYSRTTGETVIGSPYIISATLSPGSVLGNYNITYNTANFSISKKTLTGSITADNKIYDATVNATILTRTLGGVVGLDDVHYTGGTASFNTKNVGTGKAVTGNGLGLSGTDAGNYSVNSTAVTTANITAKSLTVSATASNKTYDGTTGASVTLSDDRISGDVFTASYASANFSDKNVGTGKTVTVNGISLSGTDAGNYDANTSAQTTANINPRPITVTADAKTKMYGSPDPAWTYLLTAGSLAAGDSITGALNRTAGENVGSYPILQNTLTAGTNYALTYAGANLTITPKGLTIKANDASRQYSDPNPTFTANYTGFAGTDGPSSLGGTLTFTTPANLTSGPGTYVVTPGGVTSSNYTITFNSGSLTVTKEDARITYSGLMFYSTSSTSSSTANMTLQATVRDITAVTDDPTAPVDPNAGDIRQARVSFNSLDVAIPGSCTNLTPVLVTPSDTKTGVVSCTVTFDIGSADSQQFTIGMSADYYYARNNSVDDTVITVSKPYTGFVTGGGFVLNSASNGQYAATAGSRTNFGLNVRNNKTGKNLQGNLNVIFRRLESGVWKTYQIKSNQTDSLAEVNNSPTTGSANWSGKANLADITNPLSPVSLGGGLTFQITLTDNGEPGSSDSIGFSLWNGSTLVYSSNWNGVKTAEQVLSGGNLQVR